MRSTLERRKRMELVRRLYTEKMPEEDIAKSVNLSLNTVKCYITEMGLKKRDRESISKKVIEMYLEGTPVMKIASELEVSRSYIRSVIKKNGIKSRRMMYVEKDCLIDENTVYADNNKILEKVILEEKKRSEDGRLLRIKKIYTDITPQMG